jgi:hypothetical protein
MKDLDTRTWIEAARRYVRLRRRYWRSTFGAVALFAVFGTPLFVMDQKLHSTLRGVLGSILGVGFLACWLGGVVSWFELRSFRCPRCGNQFIVSWTNTWPTNCCKHCGLDLRPAAMAI